jgi:hypothetical protein
MERRGIEGLFGAQDEGDQRDKAKRQVWIEEAKHRMQEGKTLDAVLAWLRAQGASRVDSIVVLNGAADMRLKEAKHTIHFSAVWADMKEPQERFWDELEAAAVKMPEAP